MNQKWTLHVENFARIKEADIEISPLMCFIGDNNSGKSYMMSLLWGIIANGHMFFNSSQHCIDTEEYKKCNEWLLENIGETVNVTNDVGNIYASWFNKILKVHKVKLLRKIFNYQIDCEKIEICNYSVTKEWNIILKDESDHGDYGYEPINKKSFCIKVKRDSKESLFISNFLICWNLLMFGLTRIRNSLEKKETPLYLPASRTGFILARREIFNKSLDVTYSLPDEDSEFQETLTAPYIQFLKFLNNLNDSKEINGGDRGTLIKFLENNIVNGNVRVKNKGKVIRYTPDDMNGIELPMSITSSVVTEISPFLLMLNTKVLFRLLIIEEPEAHLHPALQKKIAQLLIKFVHNGIPIWITTHSDTILQHFNNMIKLNNRLKQDRDKLLKQYNYTKNDLLSPDEINLYQFTREDTHTTIKSLESEKYGFVVPSFNKAIDELMQEIFAFQGDE